jgi:hypothetical protein
MILFIVVLLGALLGAFLLPADALTIRDDQGGRIDFYLARADALKRSHDTVRVDGACNSACTLLVASVPRGRVCVTERASLGFHRAWEVDRQGQPVDSPRWTHVLTRYYPPAFKAWIAAHGGLAVEEKIMGAADLRRLYRACP